MEVNDYLPSRVRVLSSEKDGKNEPDLVTMAPDVDLSFTEEEREKIYDLKMKMRLLSLNPLLYLEEYKILPEDIYLWKQDEELHPAADGLIRLLPEGIPEKFPGDRRGAIKKQDSFHSQYADTYAESLDKLNEEKFGIKASESTRLPWQVLF